VVRDQQGRWTKDWDAICAEMGAFQKPEEKTNRLSRSLPGMSDPL